MVGVKGLVGTKGFEGIKEGLGVELYVLVETKGFAPAEVAVVPTGFCGMTLLVGVGLRKVRVANLLLLLLFCHGLEGPRGLNLGFGANAPGFLFGWLLFIFL
ncbi:MAG: hypothetical protein WCG02_04215 [Candidatus Taylorbacteria bacterium]